MFPVSAYIPQAPHVDGWAVSLFSKQQFWGSVPQSDDFVCVQTISVFSMVIPSQAQVPELDLSSLYKKKKKNNVKKHYCNQVRSTHLLDCNFVYLLCFLWSILLFTDTDWSTCSCVSVFLCLLLNSIIIFCVY